MTVQWVKSELGTSSSQTQCSNHQATEQLGLIFTTSLCPSLITAMPDVPACYLAMTLSHSSNHGRLVWYTRRPWSNRLPAVDITSCTIQTNYSYSFWRHYSSEYEYTIRTTIRTEVNTKRIFGTSMCVSAFAALVILRYTNILNNNNNNNNNP